MSCADPTALRASMAPTDRSIPPERMTKVIPRLIKPRIVICLMMLKKFGTVRKASERRLETRMRASRPERVTYLFAIPAVFRTNAADIVFLLFHFISIIGKTLSRLFPQNSQ